VVRHGKPGKTKRLNPAYPAATNSGSNCENT
jgi:hypothetical protein